MPGLMHVIPREGTDPDAPILDIPAVVYFSDDFNRADTTKGDLGAPWEVNGRWRILNQAANLADAVASFAVVNLAPTRYKIQVWFSRSANGRGALLACYVDENNYLTYGKLDGGNSTLRLRQVIDGVTTELVDTGAAANAVTWTAGLSITDAGCQITAPAVAVDGVTYPIPAALAKATRAGIWGLNATINADNFTITDK